MNLSAKFKLHEDTVMPDDWQILEIHLHDSMMDVKFYQPYKVDGIWIHNAHSLQAAISRFQSTPKNQENSNVTQ